MFHLSPKQRVLKNFSLIILTYVLVFAAVNTNSGVQPIFNQANNLGTTSQMVLFFSQTVTTLVLPLVVCDTIGFKFGLIFAEACHLSCKKLW